MRHPNAEKFYDKFLPALEARLREDPNAAGVSLSQSPLPNCIDVVIQHVSGSKHVYCVDLIQLTWQVVYFAK